MRVFFKKKETWILVGIIVLYLILRLPNLTYQPIFADEAIYIRWAQIAKAEPGLRFISLQDGKTPLYMWLMAPFLILFSDPLFAGRFLSVIAGLFTLLGVYAIGSRYFSKRTGLIGAFLVAVTPFMIFFDRMALVDSMLATFTIWSIYWGLKLAYAQTIKNTVVLGLMIGGAWLTKTPGMVNLALLPLLLIFFEFNKPNFKKRFIKFGSFFALSGFIACCLYLIQKIDPNFHQLVARNNDYVHPWSRLLQYPVDPLIPHLGDTIQFAIPLLGSLLVFVPLMLVIPFLKRNKVGIILMLWALLPFIYELQFIKAYTARYILYSIPPFLALCAWMIDLMVGKNFKRFLSPVAILLSIVIWSAFFSYKLQTNLAQVPLAQAERRGYLEDWTAGYGLKEIANYLIDQSKTETIVVGTEGSFGTLPDGMVIYLDKYFHSSKDQKIIVLGDGPQVTDIVRKHSNDKPTFFIANKSRYPSAQPDLELIHEYPKVIGPDLPADSILFYKVNPITDVGK